MMLALALRTLLGGLLYFCEGRREEASHLTNSAGPTGTEAQSIERYADVCLPRYGIAKRLRQYRFPRSNVAGKDEKGRAITKQVHDFRFLPMMLVAPRREALRIEEQPRFFQQAVFHLIETHERSKPPGSGGG